MSFFVIIYIYIIYIILYNIYNYIYIYISIYVYSDSDVYRVTQEACVSFTASCLLSLDCVRMCQNGGTLNPEACTCECGGSFSGPICRSECIVACLYWSLYCLMWLCQNLFISM